MSDGNTDLEVQLCPVLHRLLWRFCGIHKPILSRSRKKDKRLDMNTAGYILGKHFLIGEESSPIRN